MTDKIRKILDNYNKDYDSISVYLDLSVSRNVQLEGTELETTGYKNAKKLVIRASKDGRMITAGFAGAGEDALDTFLKDGVKAIGSLPADENRYISEYAAPEGSIDICDETFDTATVPELIKIAESITRSAMESDSRVKAVKQSAVSASRNESIMISTAGPVITRLKTNFNTGAYLIASDGKEDRDGYDSTSGIHLAELDYSAVGINAAKNACSLLGAKHIDTGKYDILFSADVMSEFMDFVLELVDAESVYKGVSLLKGKLGEKCASDIFCVYDDPRIAKGVASRLADDEGQRCERVDIFSNGVLRNYLHNSYTAKALGMENNARGFVGGGGNLVVGTTNVFLQPTTDKKPEQICPDCLKITEVMGMHTADPVSGDFSVGVSGIVFKAGEGIYPFKEAVLSGNLADLLTGAIHIFDNSRTFGNITTSDTLFDKMTVSGV